jgi:cardiolipin synthase A/B
LTFPFLLKASFTLVLFLFSLISAAHAVLYKRDPRAGFGWVVTCLIFWGMGPVLYWLFGVNRIRTHAQKLHRLGYWRHQTRTEGEEWGFHPGKDQPASLEAFGGILNVSEKVNRHPLMAGNRIQILQNGEEAYPSMLEAVEGAKKFIFLCTYIFDSDETGRSFVRALEAARKRGVDVWILVDAFGEKYSVPRIGRLLKESGIPFARFLPLSFSLNSLHFNLRNHRKILVADGKTGFTGGMNIRGKHLAGKGGKAPIRDMHFKIEGPIVMELQEIFMEDWYFATRQSLSWTPYSETAPPGDSVVRVVSGGPNEDFEKIHWMLLGALAWSRKSIQVMTPYLIPSRSMLEALNTAALRGVRVEIILPENNNLPFVDWASRAYLGELLENGVEIYYQPGSFCHTKLFVADRSYSLIGSSNWDTRSLRLNFELDMEVFDSAFGGALSDHFNRVRASSRALTLEDLRKESLPARFRNSFLKLFSPYL